MTESPRPPSVLRKAVPPAVEAAVLTALEKLPADRFASAAEFVAALNGSGPLPPGRTTARQPGKSSARLRRSVIISVSLATACAALALGYRVGWQRGHTAGAPVPALDRRGHRRRLGCIRGRAATDHDSGRRDRHFRGAERGWR